ncbi:unnamed protein product [Eruca vesicaria subsp. sativa]|uniref:C-JID domain-containing protein n=1 Tax=Eruca vesicaria subsp. sativa TaxID=29727 RepID=A0ABC8LIY8_ERUVS|nr:unnamed protein product [Eruca vesicaria subsp. sativa]
MKHMPTNFRPENLVKLQMRDSKLQKLWEGVHSLAGLMVMDLKESKNLEEVPDLSLATNLQTLDLSYCSSLVELTSSIQYLKKLKWLHMSYCENLKTLPTGMYLQSLDHLILGGCSRLKILPDISTNISTLILDETGIDEFGFIFRLKKPISLGFCKTKIEKLWAMEQSLAGLREMVLDGSKNLEEVPDLSMATNLQILHLDYCSSLVELTSSIQHLNKLKTLHMSYCENLETLPTGMYLQSLDHLYLGGCSRLKILPDISTNISILILDETGIDEFSFIFRLKKPIFLGFRKTKIEKLWAIEQPLTSIITMLSPTLRRLFLSNIPSLVELPSSIQNLHNLDILEITECINLKTLPTGINLQYLHDLILRGCSRLRTFPDISTSIEQLYLGRTGIVEVPWWINKFSKLEYLGMESCSNLERVSLNIYKLKDLLVDFSDCGALTEASWTDFPDNLSPEVSTYFSCLNLDPEALLHQRPFVFEQLVMSGEEVPSYFTHRTTGTSSSLTIPLPPTSLSQPFFRFRACVLGFFDSVNTYGNNMVFIRVDCRFRGIFGDSFDYFGQQQLFRKNKIDSYLFIFECRIPLNKDISPICQLNYDHVDVQLHLSNRMDATFRSKILDPQELHHLSNISESKFNLKGWGIRLAEDCLSPKNQLGDPNTLPRVCEDNIVKQECRDSCEETENNNKRMRIT